MFTKTIILFFLSLSTLALSSESFSKRSEWLSLMRYQRSIFGYESLVVSDEYFLAKDGKTNPKAELLESIKQFQSPDIKKMDEHPRCLFPSRFMLLQKHNLISDKLNLKKCEKYQKFTKKIEIASASLIFSSYFIEKPASTFGHTFFRVRSKTSVEEDNDLLDYGVDFAAKIDTANPIMYGLKGIFGGFYGSYSLMPYYLKVKEYNDMESRDLWDYELNLTQEELDFFQAHLFDMDRAKFDYYYMTKNCSYHILAFIDAIKPEWRLMNFLQWMVPPVDTLHSIANQKDIIKKKKLRPASYTKLKTRYELMDKKQKEKFKSLKDDINNIQTIKPNKSDLFVLDTFNLYVDFSNADVNSNDKITGKSQSVYINRKFKVNRYRANIKLKSQKVEYEHLYDQSPDKSHYTNRLRLLANYDSDGNYQELEWRGALHDLIDDSTGYLPMSTTELLVPRLSFNKYQEGKVRLEDYQIVRVEALRLVNALAAKMSWQIALGIKRSDIYQNRKLNPYLDLDLGYTFGNESFAFATLLTTQNRYVVSTDINYDLAWGPKVRAIVNYESIGLSIDYKYLYRLEDDFSKTHELSGEFRYNFKTIGSLVLGYSYEDEFYQKGYVGGHLFY